MSLVPKIDCFESNVLMYRQFLFITNLLFVYSLLQSLSFSIQTNFYLNIFKVIEDRAKWTCRCMPLTLNGLRKWKLKLLVAQSYLTLCSAVSCSLPGSSVRGISQARILEWIAVSFSRGSSWPRDRTQVSCTAGRFFTIWATAASAKSRQSCPTLCDPMNVSPPGSPVPGILQARTLEWVAISFSNAWKWKVKGKSLSRVRLLATPWTAAHQAPPSMGFSRQEDWGGVPLPSPSEPLGKPKLFKRVWSNV